MEIGQVLNQKFTVIGIKNIVNHGKFYSNKAIKAEFYVQGKKGAIYRGVLYQEGNYKIERTAAFSHIEGIKNYDGTLGQYIQQVNPAEVFEAVILERFAIAAKVEIVNGFILLTLKSWQSANTLLREFRRHKATITAAEHNSFIMSLPLISKTNGLIKQNSFLAHS